VGVHRVGEKRGRVYRSNHNVGVAQKGTRGPLSTGRAALPRSLRGGVHTGRPWRTVVQAGPGSDRNGTREGREQPIRGSPRARSQAPGSRPLECEYWAQRRAPRPRARLGVVWDMQGQANLYGLYAVAMGFYT